MIGCRSSARYLPTRSCVAVQDRNLADVDKATGKPVTVAQVVAFARDTLRLDYIFWGMQEPYLSRDVLPWLQSLDVFALPSYANEGVPQALLQAMLCGLACVTTAAGSIGEIALDGSTAVVVAAESAAELRRGLEKALRDEGLRARLGKAARAHCAAGFGAQTMLDRMERVFRDAAGA